MKRILFLLLPFLLIACGKSETELAQEYIVEAQTLIDDGQLQQARITLDSLHTLYPRQVALRRVAKRLGDSIVYIESQRTAVYADSLLQTMLPQVDVLLKNFRYEKDERYENAGKYVHRLLRTQGNASRCYLQCYVSDQRETTLKSYYFGSAALEQRAVRLLSGEMSVESEGTTHSFYAEGWHEVLTLDEAHSLELLNFISAHREERICVVQAGKRDYRFYLQANEKEALEQTYQLGTLMRDIRQLEENIRIANARIERFERAE